MDVVSPARRMQQGSAMSKRLARIVGAGDGLGAQFFIQLAIDIVILLIVLIFAIRYKATVVDQIKQLPPVPFDASSRKSDFDEPLCGCMDSTDICLHSCCCPACRMAHTWYVGGVLEYWPGIYMGCCVMPFTSYLLGLGCCIGASMTGGLKKRRGITPNFGKDCISWLCWCCTVAQQATHIDKASGVTVRCCCKLDRENLDPVSAISVGQATAVASNSASEDK